MNNLSELICVQLLCETEEFVRKLENEVNDQHDLIRKEISKYDQFQVAVRDFKSDSKFCFSKLFDNALDCAKKYNSETYLEIQEVIFKLMFTCQQIVTFINGAVGSIDTEIISLVSFYKYLLKGSKHKKAAICIFNNIKEFQDQFIVTSLSNAVKEICSLLCTIQQIRSHSNEQEISDKLYKLLQPVKIMHFCMEELSKTTYYIEMYYSILNNTLFGNSTMDTDTTWNNSTTKDLFLKYFSSFLALKVLCTDFIKKFEQLRDNFRCMIQRLPKTINFNDEH